MSSTHTHIRTSLHMRICVRVPTSTYPTNQHIEQPNLYNNKTRLKNHRKPSTLPKPMCFWALHFTAHYTCPTHEKQQHRTKHMFPTCQQFSKHRYCEHATICCSWAQVLSMRFLRRGWRTSTKDQTHKSNYLALSYQVLSLSDLGRHSINCRGRCVLARTQVANLISLTEVAFLYRLHNNPYIEATIPLKQTSHSLFF